jgi:hypothetical protein
MQSAARNHAVSALLGTPRIPAAIESGLESPSQPLDQGTRAHMEQQFGQDFHDVRIHTGAAASESARDAGATAYTAGNHVVFGANTFSPITEAGRRLIAHELAHVTQQRAASPGSTLEISRSGAHEQAADAAAAGRVPGGPGLSQVAVQRKPAPSGFQVSPNEVKTEIKKRSPELAGIIANHPLQFGQYRAVKTADANGKKYEFQLAIEINDLSILESYKGKTEETSIADVKRGKDTISVHKFLITIDKKQASKMEFIETLFHELTHLAIEMDKYLPPDQHGATYAEYENAQVAAQVSGKKTDVVNAMKRVRAFVNVFIEPGLADQIPPLSMEEAAFEYLMNEKLTNARAKTAFGSTIANSTIARRYAEPAAQPAKRFLYAKAKDKTKFTQAFEDKSEHWNQVTKGIEDAALALFDAVDAILATPPPAATTAKPTQTEPAGGPKLDELVPGLKQDSGFVKPQPLPFPKEQK